MKTQWKLTDPLVVKFTKEVHIRSEEIDPDDEHDWHSLTLGWALANGMEPEEACEFASWVRYSTNLG